MQRSKYLKPGAVLDSRGDAVSELSKILEAAPARLSAISEAAASAPLDAGKWSRKQILGHLIDSATNNHHRFVRAQIEGSLEMKSYKQDGWIAVQNYQARTWADLVALWTAYNCHLLHLIATAPEGNLGIFCTVAGDESGTLEFLMVDYVAHLQHHLHQVLS